MLGSIVGNLKHSLSNVNGLREVLLIPLDVHKCFLL